MHACIAAVSQAVPSVCLAYSRKFKGVMEPLGNGAAVVELRSADTGEVLAVTRQVYKQRTLLARSLKTESERIVHLIDLEFNTAGASRGAEFHEKPLKAEGY